MSRSASALFVLHSGDPKLANIGFVWPPLPTLFGVFWSLFYPIWPGIVSSGVAPMLTTAACARRDGGASLDDGQTARAVRSHRLDHSRLLVAVHPMLFLYATNGMPEGVAAPFLIGGVCCLTLFWHSGERLWVAAAGAALALGLASVYQAVPYGAAVFVALVGGVLWSSEARVWAPQGRARAIEGLGLLLLVPPVFVGLLWIGANAVIMGDPLDFMYGSYGYGTFQRADGSGEHRRVRDRGRRRGAGARRRARLPLPDPARLHALGTARRRSVSGGSTRYPCCCLVSACRSAWSSPWPSSAPRWASCGISIFPLFAAAGWGLYEISMSRRRRAAVALILAGWVVTFPASIAVMSNPGLGPEEHLELEAVVDGHNGADSIGMRAPVAKYLSAHVLPTGRRVLLDSVAGGAMVALQLRPAHIRQLILTADRRFKPALTQPGSYGVGYFVMPDPGRAPAAAIGRAYPRLWEGKQPGFRLVKTLRTRMDPASFQVKPSEKWRIYAVQPSARRQQTPSGGSG